MAPAWTPAALRETDLLHGFKSAEPKVVTISRRTFVSSAPTVIAGASLLSALQATALGIRNALVNQPVEVQTVLV